MDAKKSRMVVSPLYLKAMSGFDALERELIRLASALHAHFTAERDRLQGGNGKRRDWFMPLNFTLGRIAHGDLDLHWCLYNWGKGNRKRAGAPRFIRLTSVTKESRAKPVKDEVLLNVIAHLNPDNEIANAKREGWLKEGRNVTQRLSSAGYAELQSLVLDTEAKAQTLRALWAEMKRLRLKGRSLIKPAAAVQQGVGLPRLPHNAVPRENPE
jgi:hypothetical protein